MLHNFHLFWLLQAQDDLMAARRADLSADLLRMQEEVRRVEMKLDQMTSERDSLMERLKVNFI